MKRYTHHIALLAALAATACLLLGCTLSMEEWNLPEEERGFDEPYTEKTPFGDVTYQFNDDVIHLTENLQDNYLLQVESDTILYISADIPKAYRPQKGMKLHAGFGYNFPFALNAEIVSVQDVGGIYKVVTRNISRDDVFKELSYSFDYEGSVDNTLLLQTFDDETLEALGYQRMEDSTLIDWNVFDSVQAAHGSEKAKARIQRRARTRALEVEDKTTIENTLSWKFDTDNLLTISSAANADVEWASNSAKAVGTLIHDIKAFDKWWTEFKDLSKPDSWKDTWKPYLAMEFNMKHFIHSHTERDEDRDFEENWTETWDEINFTVNAGVHPNLVDYADDSGDYDKRFFLNIMKGVVKDDKFDRQGYLDMVKKFDPRAASKKLKRKKSLLPFKGFDVNKAIILSPWFGLNINIDGSPTLEFAGFISASAKYTTAKRKSGKRTHDDKIETISEETAPSSGSLTEFGGKVNITVGYKVRAGVDFLIANAAGVSIGANLDASVVVNAGVDIYNSKDQDKAWGFKPNGSVKFYVDFYVDFKFVVKPLGFTLWEKPIKDFPDPHVHILYKSTKYEPEVLFGPVQYLYEDGMLVVSTCYSYYKLGGFSSLLSGDAYPMMKMYKGPMSKNDYVFMTPTAEYGLFDAQQPSLWPKAGTGKEYNFFYLGSVDTKVNEVHFVPCMVTFTKNIKTSSADYSWGDLTSTCLGSSTLEVGDEYPLTIGPPSITTVKSQQTYGDSNEFDFDQSGEFINSQGGSIDGSGGQSIDPSQLSLFKFLTQVRIFNAPRIQSCGLKVIIYNQNKKRIKAVDIPIEEPVTGTYTYIFSFVTDWRPAQWETAQASSECLYYRVIPYWTDNTIDEREDATDSKSLKYYPIEYRIDEVQINEKDKSKWGTVMPEKELN